jgi:hypothetical protein
MQECIRPRGSIAEKKRMQTKAQYTDKCSIFSHGPSSARSIQSNSDFQNKIEANIRLQIS